MKPLLLAFSSALLATYAANAGAACMTDTAQSDFQSGVSSNVDLNSVPGSVVLTKSFAVDQQNTTLGTNGTPFTTTAWVGQTFTSGLSGRLTRVDVNLFCFLCAGTPPAILVGVRATAGGLPTGPDLATATIPTISNVGAPAFYSAIFATPATLTAGTQYALVIRPTTDALDGTFAMTRAGSSTLGSDVYAGGALVDGSNSGSSWIVQTFNSGTTSDAGFKTYIHGGYAPDGTWTSSLRDSNPPVGAMPVWSNLSWTASTPTNTAIRFQVAASDSSGGPFEFVGPDTTTGSFFTTSGASLSQFNGKRYLQYRAELLSTNSTATPTLSDATVCFATTSGADLTITNSDGVTSSTAGGQVTYTITVTNTGPSSISGASVNDSFPSALTCMWSCTVNGSGQCTAEGWGNIADTVNLTSGSSAVYTATCAVASTATGSLANTASVAPPSGVSDPNPASNTATDMDTVAVTTNVAMALDDGAGFVRTGEIVDYVVELTNANGPSDAVVNVADALPAQLSGGSWVCTGSGSAVCHSGNGNTLTDIATVPAGGKVDYLYSATVAATAGTIVNSGSGALQFGTNLPSSNIGATDTDTIVVFRDGFEGDGLAAGIVVAPSGPSAALQLGVDSGLLAKLGIGPKTIASGRAADGRVLFHVDLVRLGSAVALRAVLPAAAGTASRWQTIDLRQGLLGLNWRPGSGRHGSDGYLALSAGSAQLRIAQDAPEPLARLQVTVEQHVPWLVRIAP